MNEIADWTASEALREIGEGRISAREYAEALLAECERGAGLNAFIHLDPERALDAASRAEARGGRLAGLPVPVKDNFDTAGMPTTGGTPGLRDHRPTRNAPVLQRLIDEGAWVMGKLNMHELAFGITSNNGAFGPARNPYDPARIPGGSSGGSGAAVAARMAPVAMGTDTGGSVRIPAGLCGLAGLKPTHLRVSQQGIYPLAGEFDTGGPMTRSVGDAALMMQALDPDGGFGGHRPLPSLDGIRIGVLESLFDDGVDTDIGRLTRAAIAILGDLGAELQVLDLPFAAEATAAWNTIALGRTWAIHGERAEAPDSRLAPSVRDRVLTGRDISAADIEKALTVRRAVQAQVSGLMRRFDAFVLPTVPIPAVDAEDGRGHLNGAPVDGAAALGRLCRLASFTGQPAVSIPSGLTAGGLPAGLQLIGDWNRDEALLEIAACFEAASGWSGRRPPVEDGQ